MTSEWRHVQPIWTNNKSLQETPPRAQFLSYDQLSHMIRSRISRARKLLYWIFTISKISKIVSLFIFSKKSHKTKIFKNRQYVRWQWLMNMCTTFQVCLQKWLSNDKTCRKQPIFPIFPWFPPPQKNTDWVFKKCYRAIFRVFFCENFSFKYRMIINECPKV